MELLLQRRYKGLTCTIGELFINDLDGLECYTLEDVIRQVAGKPVSDWKIPKQSAIPTGRYEVIITKSKRFGFETPILLNVDGFDAIRIHKGNTDADTEGCILVGRIRDRRGEAILESKLAFDALVPKIRESILKGEKVFITIA